MDSESKSSAQSNLHPDAGKIYLEYMRRIHSYEEIHPARANELSKRPLNDDELKCHLRRKETLDRWRADDLEKIRRSKEKRATVAQAAKRLKTHEAEQFRMTNKSAELSGLRNHISVSGTRSLDLTNASDQTSLKEEKPTMMAAVSQDHASKPDVCMYVGHTRGTYSPATTPFMNPSSSSAEQPDVNMHHTAGRVLRSYLLANNLPIAPHHLKLMKEFARRPLTKAEHREHLERVRFLEEHERPQTFYVGSTQQQRRQRLMQAKQQRQQRLEQLHQQYQQQQLEKQQRQERQHQQQQLQQQAKNFLPMTTPSLSPNRSATGYRDDAPDSSLPAFLYTVDDEKLHPLMTSAGDPVGHGNRRPLCPAPLYNDNGADIGASKSPASCQAPLTSGTDTAAVSVSQDYVDIDEYMGHQCKSATTQSLWSPEVVVSTPALPTAEVQNDSKPALWGSSTGPCKPEPPLPTPAPTLASEDQSLVSTPSGLRVDETQKAETKDEAQTQIGDLLEEKLRCTGIPSHKSATEAGTSQQAGRNPVVCIVDHAQPCDILACTVQERQERQEDLADERRWPAFMKSEGVFTEEEVSDFLKRKWFIIPPSAGEKYINHAQQSELVRQEILRSAQIEKEYMETKANKTTGHHTQPQSKNKALRSKGTSKDSVKKSTLRPADPPASDLPTTQKDTTASLSFTVKDLLAFKARNPAKNSSSLLSNASIEATVDSASTSGMEAIQDETDTTAATQKNYPKPEDVYNGTLASGLRLNPPDLPWRSFERPESFAILPQDVEKCPAPFSWGTPKAGEETQLPSDEEIRNALNGEQEKPAADQKQGAGLTNASIARAERDAPIADVRSPRLIAIWHERAEMEKKNRSLRYLAQAEQARIANVEKEQPRQPQDEVTKATIQEQNKKNAEAGINFTKAAKPQNIAGITASVNSSSADRGTHAEAETKDDNTSRPDARNDIARDTSFWHTDSSFYTQRTHEVPISANYHPSSARCQHGFPQPFVQSSSTHPMMKPALPVRPKLKETKKDYSARVQTPTWGPTANGKPYEWYRCAGAEPLDSYKSAKGQPFEWYEPFLPKNGEDQKPEVKEKTVPAHQKSMLDFTKERPAQSNEEAERKAGRLRLAHRNLEQEKLESYRTQQSHLKQVNANEDSSRKWQVTKEARDEKDEVQVQQERQACYETMKQQKSTPQQLALEEQQKMMAANAEKMKAQPEQEQRNHVPVMEQQKPTPQQLALEGQQKMMAANAEKMKAQPEQEQRNHVPVTEQQKPTPQQLALEKQQKMMAAQAEKMKAQPDQEQPNPEVLAISERMAHATSAMKRSMQLVRDTTGPTPEQKDEARKRIDVEYKMKIMYLTQRRKIVADPIAMLEERQRTMPVGFLPEKDRTIFGPISKAANIITSVETSLSEVQDNTSSKEIEKGQSRIQNAEKKNQGNSISWDREVRDECYDDTGKKMSLRAEPKRTLQRHKDNMERIAKEDVKIETEQAFDDMYDVSGSESESDQWFEAKEGNEVETEQVCEKAEATSNGEDFDKVSQASQEDVVPVEEPASIGGEALTGYKQTLAKLEAYNKERLRLARAEVMEKVAVFEGDDKIVSVEVEMEDVEDDEEDGDEEVMEGIEEDDNEDDEWETLTMDEGQGSNGRCGGAWW